MTYPVSRLTAGALAFALAFAGPTVPAAAQDTMVRVGTDVDAGTLDSRLMRDTTAYRAVNLLYSGLLQLNENLQPEPDLAVRWENPDPTTWIFHLREGVAFHDGAPVTAEDVKFTLDTILDPALKARFRSLYTPIDSVEAVDPLTVRISLKEPYAPLLSYLDLGIVPKHAVEAGVDIGNEPIGSGPYRLRRWDKGSKIVFEANPDFWDGAPTIEAIEMVLVPDNTARAQALESGDLDMIQSPLSPQDIKRLAANPDVGKSVQGGIAITYLNFNTARPNLSDPRVRRALAMLVDQDTIVDQIYEGTDRKATSILLSSWDAYDEAIRQPRFDPDGAKALLAEAGWTDSNGDGVLDKDGRKLAIELGTHSEDPNRIQTVEYIQFILGQHGVEANLRISDWPSFSARFRQGDYELILVGWTQLVDPDRVTFGQLHGDGGFNWGGYRNATLDGLLERGRAESDAAERIRIYREAAAIIADEVPYYILSYQGYQVFFDPRIEGYRSNPRGMLRSLSKATLK